MNVQLRPRCSYQCVLGDQFPSTFNQGSQDGHGACSETDRIAIPQEKLSRGDQTKLPEREPQVHSMPLAPSLFSFSTSNTGLRNEYFLLPIAPWVAPLSAQSNASERMLRSRGIVSCLPTQLAGRHPEGLPEIPLERSQAVKAPSERDVGDRAITYRI